MNCSDDKAIVRKNKISSSYERGILTHWNAEKGYGFILSKNSDNEVFLHIKSLQSSATYPIEGEEFYYQTSKDKQGRIQAVNAFQTENNKKRKISLFHQFIKLLASSWPLVIFLYLILIYLGYHSHYILCLAFTVNSLLTILFYYEDKYRASFNFWRIKESYLHIWELIGGWPGALYAQYAFHHKKSKFSYMLIFALCVAINVFTLYLIFFT